MNRRYIAEFLRRHRSFGLHWLRSDAGPVDGWQGRQGPARRNDGCLLRLCHLFCYGLGWLRSGARSIDRRRRGPSRRDDGCLLRLRHLPFSLSLHLQPQRSSSGVFSTPWPSLLTASGLLLSYTLRYHSCGAIRPAEAAPTSAARSTSFAKVVHWRDCALKA